MLCGYIAIINFFLPICEPFIHSTNIITDLGITQWRLCQGCRGIEVMTLPSRKSEIKQLPFFKYSEIHTVPHVLTFNI